MVPDEPEPTAREMVLKFGEKKASPPTDEALKLAELAADTIEGFDRRFKGELSFRHPMPGMIATDESALKYEALLTSMIGTAFQERVRNYFGEEFRKVNRAERLEDEERRKKDMPDYAKQMADAVPDMLQKIDDIQRGVKHVQADSPEVRESTVRIARLIGIDPTATLRSIYDPPTVESSESTDDKTATTDPPPDDSGSA